MLATQVRETGGVPGQHRSANGSRCRPACLPPVCRHGTAPPALDQLGIGSTHAHLLTGEVSGDVSHVLIAEVIQHTGHLHHRTGTGLDVVQLLEQVALALTGQLGEVRCRAVAIGAMAGTTDSDFALTGFGIASSLCARQ